LTMSLSDVLTVTAILGSRHIRGRVE
jgi:hypothetical protein